MNKNAEKMIPLLAELMKKPQTNSLGGFVWDIILFITQNIVLGANGEKTLNFASWKAEQLIKAAEAVNPASNIYAAFAGVCPYHPTYDGACSEETLTYWTCVQRFFVWLYGEDEGTFRFKLAVGHINFSNTFNVGDNTLYWMGSGWYVHKDRGVSQGWYYLADPTTLKEDAQAEAVKAYPVGSEIIRFWNSNQAVMYFYEGKLHDHMGFAKLPIEEEYGVAS